MTTDSTPANPGVRFPPPLLFLLGFGIAWLLEKYVLRINLAHSVETLAVFQSIGLLLTAAGFALMFWGLFTFARVRTGIVPMRPATRIVTHGPYRFTRNPMYTGMATALAGGALIVDSGWTLAMIPFVMLTVYHLVIKREERYLTSAFPAEYGEYKARVRRFL
ncbi:MAG: isoprenylcysteine carboxylmethyltransferase family protein [Gemmatimonadaceae bacterium]